MSGGPHTPPVTDAAIDAAARALAYPEQMTAGARKSVRRALEAAAPHMVPPPALPTDFGSVVLATRIRDCEFDRPVLAVRVPDGHMGTWVTPGIRLAHPIDGAASIWLDAPDIAEWIPARVVPDDEHGPVAVLRRVSERLAAGPGPGEVEDLLIVVGVCLDRLDGAE